MELKKSAKYLGSIAGALGIIQGVVWLILCIFGAVKRYQDVFIIPISFADNLKFQLYLTFFDYVSILNGKALIIIVYMYIVLSVIWISTSATLIMNIRRPATTKTKSCYLTLGTWTLLICCFDLIVVGLLGSTYSKALQFYVLDQKPFRPLAYGILLCLAARGFVLWAINLILGILLIRQALNFSKKSKTRDDVPNMINAFDDGRHFAQQGLVNSSYNWEDDVGSSYNDHIHIEPAQSSQNFDSLRNYPKIIPKPHFTENTAKLGKSGPRSHLHNVAPPKPPKPPKPPNNYIYPLQPHPKIPNPDYSPPIQPQLKSALKNQPPQNPFVFNRNNNPNRY